MNRLIHYGSKVRANDGACSALCFARPRAIGMRRASWTIDAGAVTCPKCRRLLLAGKVP